MNRAKRTHPITLDAEGYFRRGAKRVMPVGVNYWPASCGVEMWRAWPAAEIRHDLRLVRKLGLNCVRFFLRWQDFEPRPGHYSASAFRRLEEMLSWCRGEGLLAHPSLFVGWMSGGIFWPEWKRGRNLFGDAFMRRRAAAFAARAARVLARHRDVLLAIDQGNELCCLPESSAAPPADVVGWCAGVNAAVRRACPGVLLVSGNEQTQVIADSGWRLGAQPGCDFYSMHAYPNSAWHALAFDGMTDPLAQSLLPFYVKCARAFGPTLVQEFGTLFTAGRCAEAYLRPVLAACAAAGANGFLSWCLRDITARGHPYDKNAFEGGMGLVGADNRVKPALRCFLEFARRWQTTGGTTLRVPHVSLYWPEFYYHRDEPLNPGNEPRALSRRMAIAHFALEQTGLRVGIARGGSTLPQPGSTTLVIPGALLTAGEAAALVAWVRAGGRLIWHAPDVTTWGAEVTQLTGAEPVDFLAPVAKGVRAFRARWDFKEFSRGVFPGVEPRRARVIARDSRAWPVLLSHALGRGRVVTCLASPEDRFAAESADRRARAGWARWYRGVLKLAHGGGDSR
jgi:hypothetical protein